MGVSTIKGVRWIEAWDVVVFRWINGGWSHPWMDAIMRSLSGHPLFVPALVTLGLGLVWRGGRRGRVFVLMLGLSAGFANALVADPMKRGVARPRPYVVVPEARLRVGRGNPLGGMPSAHAMNCALMATVAGWYYRRSLRWTAPLAIGVAVSRVYNGAHFPTDVLAGALLGTGSGLAMLLGTQQVWAVSARRWAPACFGRMPSLLEPERGAATAAVGAVGEDRA